MEQGLEINFKKLDKATVIEIGKLNVSRLARALVEFNDGIPRKPLASEINHDGRLKEFQQYPKGTKVKSNGEVVKGS
ncbi:hypothetical protein A374_11585 [Fictibacillus macauensis ZFHKF-1]|uniref:Uncharacterized protein n=1 Tax=Fictibacillus macauensis ZFHKF-1 TaxID=1196324 RepID=I8UEY8_9BACL|nr:hypothetical protein [Fictibacillus macauensis]EIT85383.1 hypothetical protein A374_11585 [Fictibacillus macauensis ZFHKF-1]